VCSTSSSSQYPSDQNPIPPTSRREAGNRQHGLPYSTPVHNAADLIRAIAALAWPVVLIVFLFVARHEIVGLMQRLRRGKIPGAEFEFDKPLDALERVTERAEQSAARSPVVYEKSGSLVAGTHLGGSAIAERDQSGEDEHPVARPTVEAEKAIEDEIAPILASGSPKAALVILSAELERAARVVLASSQDPANWERQPFWQTLSRLDLSPTIREAVNEFREVRNKIVHGRGASDDEALRAIDSGLRIVRAVESIPFEIHVVYDPDVPIFADEAGQTARPVHGVLLESQARGGEPEYRIFPTSRTDLEKGKAVTWEWSFDRVWPESWYRDPRDGGIKYAWTSSAEFAGRHIEDL
jgi:hypothetical protein